MEGDVIESIAARIRFATGCSYSTSVEAAAISVNLLKPSHDESKNRIADLEARLATAEGEVVRLREPWQPIETAPKDGVFVLITDGDVVQIGYYEDHLTAWRSDADQCRLWSDPTHWQPLPAPPERAGK